MKDMLGRELEAGDFVVYYSSLYRVEHVATGQEGKYGYVKILIHNPSKTSRPLSKYSREMVKVPAEDVTALILKNGSVF